MTLETGQSLLNNCTLTGIHRILHGKNLEILAFRHSSIVQKFKTLIPTVNLGTRAFRNWTTILHSPPPPPLCIIGCTSPLPRKYIPLLYPPSCIIGCTSPHTLPPLHNKLYTPPPLYPPCIIGCTPPPLYPPCIIGCTPPPPLYPPCIIGCTPPPLYPPCIIGCTSPLLYPPPPHYKLYIPLLYPPLHNRLYIPPTPPPTHYKLYIPPTLPPLA